MTPVPERILIVRLSAIGDVVHSLPILCALRKQFPSARLGWVVEGRTADLLRGHAALDELIVAPRGWVKSPRQVLALRRRLRESRFDVSIDVQGLSKSGLAAWLSGAPRRIGLAGPDGRELSQWFNNDLVSVSATHVIDRNLELLGPLGVDTSEVRFDLPRHPTDDALVDIIIDDLALEGGYAVITPGAGWPSKLWPVDRFAAVARHLGEEHGLASVVVWAGEQERDWAAQIVDDAEGHARLAPPTSLTQLAALVRRARLFLGSDTGPLHIAAAVGTRCVGLFGPMPAERNGPYGAGHIAVQRKRIRGSSRERRNAGPESMAAITVEEVCCACDQLVLRRRQQAA